MRRACEELGEELRKDSARGREGVIQPEQERRGSPKDLARPRKAKR
jgi:hypothetical protein